MKNKTLLKISTSIVMMIVLLFGTCILMGTSPKKAIAENITLTDNTVLSMEKGASIRIQDPAGIRFKANIDESLLDTSIDPVKVKNGHEIGMIILPSNVLNDTALFEGNNYKQDVFNYLKTKYNKDKNAISTQFQRGQIVLQDNKYQANGSIVNLLGSHFSDKYQAIAYYATVTPEGQVTDYKYTLPSEQRSIMEVARKAVADKNTELNAEQINFLNENYCHLKSNFIKGNAGGTTDGWKLVGGNAVNKNVLIDPNWGRIQLDFKNGTTTAGIDLVIPKLVDDVAFIFKTDILGKVDVDAELLCEGKSYPLLTNYGIDRPANAGDDNFTHNIKFSEKGFDIKDIVGKKAQFRISYTHIGTHFGGWLWNFELKGINK